MNSPLRLFLRALGFLALVGLLALLGSACRNAGDAHPTPAPAPEAPALDPEPLIWGGYSDRVYWQKTLYSNLKKDIRWGLPDRKTSTKDVVFIPAGEAVIGCGEGQGHTLCLPERKAVIDAFFIDRREVTNAAYNACVMDRQCLPPSPAGHIPDWDAPDRPALLTYKQAERYCLWAGKRLPTGLEWEKAARGSKGRIYPWGDEPPEPDRANICGSRCVMVWADAGWDDGFAFTAPVGSFPKGDTPTGIKDAAGNVKEWVQSQGDLEPNVFINRGSSWYSPKDQLPAFTRQIWRPGVRLDDKGVRCAKNAK